jgi:hypothetical protein
VLFLLGVSGFANIFSPYSDLVTKLTSLVRVWTDPLLPLKQIKLIFDLFDPLHFAMATEMCAVARNIYGL